MRAASMELAEKFVLSLYPRISADRIWSTMFLMGAHGLG
jgi:hypothetical protein